MRKIRKLIPLIVSFIPIIALAKAEEEAEEEAEAGFASLVDTLIDSVIDPLVFLLIAVAVIIFLYGVVKFIGAAGDEAKRKEGKDLIIYGIIGLFVMVSVWGLVNVLVSTFSDDLDTTSIPTPIYYTP